MVRTFCLFFAACLTITSAQVQAAEPSENVFPTETTGYLAVGDAEVLKANFEKTQIGKLFADPKFKPFVKVLAAQFRGKLSDPTALGISWDDVKALGKGEGAIAAIQPENDPRNHAIAVFADIEGRQDEVKTLIAKLEAAIKKKGGSSQVEKIADRETTVFTIKIARKPDRKAYYRLGDKYLIASDQIDVLNGMSERLEKKSSKGSLAENEAFKNIMKRCVDAKRKPDIRWFIDPMGYVETTRAAHPDPRFDGNTLKIFKEEGFDAVAGVGGTTAMGDEAQDMLHRIKIFVPGEANQLSKRLKKSAKVLDFPNVVLKPEAWVPPTVSSYFSMSFNMRDALTRAKPLLNKLLGAEEGEDLIDDVLDGIEKDEFGPQVNLVKELLDHLDGRMTAITTHRTPIDTNSGRWLIGIRVKNLERVQKAIDKLMQNEQNAKQIDFLKEKVWQIVEAEADAGLDIEDGDLGQDDEEDLEGEEDEAVQEKLISSFALFVMKTQGPNGYILISSHIDFLGDVIKQSRNPKVRLDQMPDYVAVETALGQVSKDPQCVRQFGRPALVMAPTYELLRQGKLPESETLVGKVINRIMGSEDGVVRKQKIDGSKMPAYDVVTKHLGVSGFTTKTEADGWMITSLLLKK